jgi:hypothetical protein
MKNYIAYIFQGIGLLGILGTSLFGISYIFNGNEIISVLGALGLILILWVLVSFMMKGKELNVNKGFTITEGISIGLYAVFAIASFFIIKHFINVDFVLKDDIKTSTLNKLGKIESMFTDYKKQVDGTLDIVDTNIRSAILSKSRNALKDTFALNGININKVSNYDSERTNIKAANEKRALNGLVSLEQDFLTFRQKKERILNKWQQFQLNRTLLEIDDEYDNTLSTLQTKFEAPEENKAWNRFKFNFEGSPRQDDLIVSPQALNDKYKPSWIIPILFAFVMHLFAVSPYLTMGRLGTRRIYIKKYQDKVIGID